MVECQLPSGTVLVVEPPQREGGQRQRVLGAALVDVRLPVRPAPKLLSDDSGLLTVLDGMKRAARDWASNAKASTWLAHRADRPQAVEQVLSRSDLAANLELTDKQYVLACRQADEEFRLRTTIRNASLMGLVSLAWPPFHRPGTFIRSR